MSRDRSPLSPEVEALLERERAIAPLADPVRARALSRARAALIAGRVTAPAAFSATPRRPWWVSVAAASLAAAAVAATAYELGAHRRPATGNAHAPPVTSVVATPPPFPEPPTAAVAEPPSTPAPAPSPASSARSAQAEPGPDELRLLQQARSAVARHDFAAALPPIAEHAHRFRNGRLAEEREALRVRALSALGRTEEAQRAANAFEARFPRSVLLPAVSQMPASRP